jgi:phenylacetate-CoA ligase
MELTVIVPCLNEAGNLLELVQRFAAVFRELDEALGGRGAELLLVDDGSTDGSDGVMRELSARHAFLRVVRHAKNRGMAAAWKSGAEAARGELVALIDADLQYQPEDLLRLRHELLHSDADLVQGYRTTEGRARDSRYFYSRGLNFLLNRLFGMHATDNKSGFIICAREVLLDLLDHRGQYAYWQTFLLVAAHHKGYRYRELPTPFAPRKAGVSFLAAQPIRPILRTLVDLGRGLVEYRLKPARSSDLRPILARHPVVDRSPPRRAVQAAHLRGYFASFGATHWMMTRDVETHFAELSRSQWLPLEAMRELQEHKLRRLVRHAYQHVPYYRETLRRLHIAPEDIRTLDDLAKLPLLSKDDIRQHLDSGMLSDNHRQDEVLRITTSGSTGEPFVCCVDRAQLEFRWAATLRSQEWTGYRFGDRTLRLWHQTLGMDRSQVIRERADAILSRRRFIPAYEMSSRNLAALCAEIREFGPVLVDGYAESFNFLAQYLQQRGHTLGKPLSPSLRGIISSAQSLPEASRRIIEEAFGCPVFDKYGAREFSGIAYECEAHAGHHIVSEGYIVEVWKDGRRARPGEVGEILITDLNNYCLPFLRYRIGDLGEAMDESAPCACGRGLPRIGNIEGRVQSIILGDGGRYLPSSFFLHLFKDYAAAIRHFQVVQEKPGELILKIVKGERYTDETLHEVMTILQRFVGPGMRIALEFVDGIPLGRTGKRLAAISKLKIDFQKLPLEG